MEQLSGDIAEILRRIVAGRVDITIHIVSNGDMETPPAQGLTVAGATWEPLSAIIDTWERDRLQDGRTPRYVRGAASAMRACCDRNGWKDPAQVNEQGIRLWLMELKGRGDKPPSASHYNNSLGAMNVLCRLLVKRKYLADNPCDDVRGRPQDEVDVGFRAISVDELGRLVHAARNRPAGRSGQEGADIYMLAFWTGLRRGEIANLRAANVDLDGDPSIVLKPKDSKGGKVTGRIERIPIVGEEVAGILSHRLAVRPPTEPLFPRLPRDHVFRRDAERAGLQLQTASGRLVFHSLRHGLATALVIAGVPGPIAQNILRHRQLSTTMKRYVDQNMLPAREALLGTYRHYFAESSGKGVDTGRQLADTHGGTIGGSAMRFATPGKDAKGRGAQVQILSPCLDRQSPFIEQSPTTLPPSGAGRAAPASGPTASVGFLHLSLSSAVPAADPAGMVFAQDHLAECDGGLIYLGSASGALPGVVPPQGSAPLVGSSGAVSGAIHTGSVDPAFSVPSGAASDFVSPPRPASGAAGRAGLSDSDSALMREAVRVIARLLVRLDGGG